MDVTSNAIEKLHQIRQARADMLAGTINYADPNLVSNMIADAISLLETAFVIINMPRDGFVSITPEEAANDKQQQD